MTQALTPQDCTLLVLLTILSKMLVTSPSLSYNTDVLFKLYKKKMLPKLESMEQNSLAIGQNNLTSTSQAMFDGFAEGPPSMVPSSALMNATHYQTFAREVVLSNLSGSSSSQELLSEDSDETPPRNHPTQGISRSSRNIKKSVLPKRQRKPKKSKQFKLPRRIVTKQKKGKKIDDVENLKKDIQKKAVNYWDRILRVQGLKSGQFVDKRYLAACLQVSCLKAKDRFTEFIYCILVNEYFEWLTTKIEQEQEVWRIWKDPISRRTIEVYKLAKQACLLLQEGKWFESIQKFFDNQIQKEKLNGNIIFFLREMALFNDQVKEFMDNCDDLNLKTPWYLEQIVRKFQPYKSSQEILAIISTQHRIEPELPRQDSSEPMEEESIEPESQDESQSLSEARPVSAQLEQGDIYHGNPRRNCIEDYFV